ncbi:hypothetical protein JMM63_19720 [Rhodovulum sulfidophilum]|nr:hypothetical protein [Rhodovulum sulfidophilum]
MGLDAALTRHHPGQNHDPDARHQRGARGDGDRKGFVVVLAGHRRADLLGEVDVAGAFEAQMRVVRAGRGMGRDLFGQLLDADPGGERPVIDLSALLAPAKSISLAPISLPLRSDSAMSVPYHQLCARIISRSASV